MQKYKDKTNYELGIILNDIKIEHENIKTKMLNDYERMEKLEKTFGEINNVILKRLKNE